MKFPEQFRWQEAPHGYHSSPGDPGGIFRIPGRHANGRELRIIASAGQEGLEWEHVSVSIPGQPLKCPRGRKCASPRICSGSRRKRSCNCTRPPPSA